MEGFAYFPAIVYRDERPELAEELVPHAVKYLDEVRDTQGFLCQSGSLQHDPAFRAVADYLLLSAVGILQDQGYDTSRYDFYLSADGRHDWNVETFRDSDAVLAHMDNVRDLLPALAEVASFTRLQVIGDLSDAGYAALSEITVGEHELIGRISR